MAFISKSNIHNNTSSGASNNGTNGQNKGIENDPITIRNLGALNVKQELRPLARHLVQLGQDANLIDRVDASKDREDIKRRSKNEVVELAQELANMLEDKNGHKLYIDKNSGNTRATAKSNALNTQGGSGGSSSANEPSSSEPSSSDPSNNGTNSAQEPSTNEPSSSEPSANEPSANEPSQAMSAQDIQALIESTIKSQSQQAPTPSTTPSASGKLEHWQMPLLKAIIDTNRQALLVGGAGTGKTTIAEQVAEYLGFDVAKQFYSISLSSGVSEAHLTGRMNMKGEFIETEFLNIVENGGLILLDEFDNADPDVLVGLNSLLANDVMSTPLRRGNEVARRAQNCYIIATANTWGNGSSGSAGYVRKQLDSATLDRFVCSKMYLGQDRRIENLVYGLSDEKPRYPKSYETLAVNTPTGILDEVKKLRTSFRAIRASVDDPRRNVRKIVGIRASAQGARLIRQAKFDFRSVLEIYLSNWTDDELATIDVSRERNAKDDYFQYDFSRFCENNRLAQ